MEHLLLVGLGNPGEKYKGNRHNIGFTILDAYGKQNAVSWKDGKKNESASINGDGYKLHLVKPKEYMNLSGSAVQTFVQTYKISPSQILVLQDEVDLPFGKIKNKIGGGTAGHNGLKDIVAKIGSGDFHRLRFGVGKPEKGQMDVADFVLQNFNSDEKVILDQMINDAVKKIEDWIQTTVASLKRNSG